MIKDQAVDTEVPSGIDRRSALKKAALAAGVTAWVAPAVIAATPRHASAAGVTNCYPDPVFRLIATGGNCADYNAMAGTNYPPSCCEGHSYGLALATTSVSCGSSCGGVYTGAAVDSVMIEACTSGTGADCMLPKQTGCPDFVQPGNCGSGPGTTVSLSIRTYITCGDGVKWNCLWTVGFDLTSCPSSASETSHTKVSCVVVP